MCWSGEALVFNVEWFQAGPGALVYGPREIPHGFRVIGEGPARMLRPSCTGASWPAVLLEFQQRPGSTRPYKPTPFRRVVSCASATSPEPHHRPSRPEWSFRSAPTQCRALLRIMGAQLKFEGRIVRSGKVKAAVTGSHLAVCQEKVTKPDHGCHLTRMGGFCALSTMLTGRRRNGTLYRSCPGFPPHFLS